MDNNQDKPREIGAGIAQKSLEPISYFEKDAGFVFVYKKTEKLASAVYIITNLFSESEPMKWALRKKVGELLSFIIDYKDMSLGAQEDLVYNAKNRVLDLVALLEVSLRGGLISNMNFSIIKQEFSNLLETLNSSNSSSEIKKESYPNVSRVFLDSQTNEQNEGKEVPKNYYIEPSNGQLVKRNVSTNASLKRTNRQNIIIGLLKKKKEVTIKDISDVIKDCSEKTIQRELNSFIIEGMVKRKGERRWSKYSLV